MDRTTLARALCSLAGEQPDGTDRQGLEWREPDLTQPEPRGMAGSRFFTTGGPTPLRPEGMNYLAWLPLADRILAATRA